MDQGPLVSAMTDAGAELVRRLNKYFLVQTAFWLKDSEAGQWYLFIASDQIDDSNIDVAYGEVLRVANEIGSPYLDPFQVKPIAASDPLAQAALDIRRRYPGSTATRFGSKNFGGMSIEAAYIYPVSVSAPAP
jgi:hypothetical protein